MKRNSGFTLIEIIITITLIAVAAALFVAYIGTSFTQSPVSSGMVAKQYALIQQMELITSQYRQEINNGTLNLNNFKTYVDANPYIDSSNFTTLSSGSYTTQQVLVVALKDGDQTIMSIFTQ
ncbi:MAG TPA: prepilin-type N-terminal cleavage/methylation domain-containing protein [Smithellaceae bacterium]|nr:prepilin-type N-terminal cleavage/methylation domain-containing protein [Smithellaceae bacterium]HRS89204.1 prepilin-type N-terminal cleavage/methylation domain-containing protein [Smithellaceae bacterium]HRV26128.1 prepilin-type N-terminal cleavage/methylation domain-containing protein [Smithellaceae bacterium]